MWQGYVLDCMDFLNLRLYKLLLINNIKSWNARRPFSYDYLNIISLVVWNLHELNNHFLLWVSAHVSFFGSFLFGRTKRNEHIKKKNVPFWDTLIRLCNRVVYSLTWALRSSAIAESTLRCDVLWAFSEPRKRGLTGCITRIWHALRWKKLKRLKEV